MAPHEPNPGDLPDLDAMFGNPNALTMPVECCPRCAGEHEGLTFTPLAVSDEFTHWASCPTTREPILAAFLLV